MLADDDGCDEMRVSVVINGKVHNGGWQARAKARELYAKLKASGWTDGGRSAWCACCCN